jgi:hypothetical protein
MVSAKTNLLEGLSMSALGHKRTFRSAIAMSLYPQKRTFALHKSMSAKGADISWIETAAMV